MLPFGKQQEILAILSTANPEDLSGKPPGHCSLKTA
jgi:hypothetical protein